MHLTDAEVIVCILLAIVLSGLIEMERENLRKPTGLRTNTLVGLGSTLVMLVALYFIGKVERHPSNRYKLGSEASAERE